MNGTPALLIGLPVHNGERFLAETLESLLVQTVEDWRLIAADNASTDGTGEILERYAARDGRIRYFRHAVNIGAANNFRFLLDQADTPYFMWAAADDHWEPNFIQTCLDQLRAHPRRGMAFTGLDNTDSCGRPIRQYPDIPGLAGKACFRTIRRYLLSPEALGKANLIYSIYRTPVCRRAMEKSPMPNVWGSDMAFVLTALAEAGIAIQPQVLFHKRLVLESGDSLCQEGPSPYRLLELSCPLERFPEYAASLLCGLAWTPYYPMARLELWRRMRLLHRLDDMRRGLPSRQVRALRHLRWFFTGRTPSLGDLPSFSGTSPPVMGKRKGAP
ncbi:glycosyltransferase [Solidesulfovibrio sp.]|uniref:glycosyltransferase family 2 protein n=1 Tax=Solidesulfovibrio sp. TaxID=2910990 RepID=UPI002607CA0C|nr:glycosyltransferase [Solidesulfovibrio sp.]